MPSFILSAAGYVIYYTGYWTLRAMYSMVTTDPAVILLLPKYF